MSDDERIRLLVEALRVYADPESWTPETMVDDEGNLLAQVCVSATADALRRGAMAVKQMCIAIVPVGEMHRRCRRWAVHGSYCERHAREIAAAIPPPSERHVCDCNRICERLLQERFGEEPKPT